MALKIKNLEHLDGKSIRYSTITSQFPDIFVNRKKNSGEFIITTDTDPEYGMHHIYAGGEHIAGGYGFASAATRDDLCYIQETYQGVFNYFDQAYTYHSNAYVWLKSYVLNSYAYTLQSLNYNSYLNASVNPDYNKIPVNNDVTYIFNFDKGVLSITYDNESEITINESSEVLLNRHITFLTDGVLNNVSTKYIMYLTGINIHNGSGIYKNIEADNIVDIVLKSEDDSGNNLYNNFMLGDSIDGLTALTENIKQVLTTQSSFEIPIFKDIDTEFYILYKKNTDFNDETVYETPHIKFIWIDPIYVVATTSVNNITNDNCSIPEYTHLIDYKNQKALNNVIVNITTAESDENEYLGILKAHSHFYVCLSKYITENKNPKFYLSEDITKRADMDGGMSPVEYIENTEINETDIGVHIFNNNYQIFRSNDYYLNKKIRMDIVF